MEVSLPPQLEQFVRAQVRAGAYADEQEVVRDALRQMRALVKAAEDPTVSGLVRDAMGIANQAQREVAHVLQIADRETTVLGEVVGHATSLANAAFDVVRKVPGARELDRIVRGPVELLTSTAEQGEMQAKAIRQNLEATAKALGLLTSVLERVNSASRAVNSVILPDPNS
jgi:Arc/MetJ-type ribon-helix-helix transcriptional regulator